MCFLLFKDGFFVFSHLHESRQTFWVARIVRQIDPRPTPCCASAEALMLDGGEEPTEELTNETVDLDHELLSVVSSGTHVIFVRL
jgi:hypothetical protein